MTSENPFAVLTVDQKIRLRGAMCELLTALQGRIDAEYRRGRETGDFTAEYALCDDFMAIYRQFNRCDPYPVTAVAR